MKLSGFNEYGALKAVAVRTPDAAYQSDAKITDEWQQLRFHAAPDLAAARAEHAAFCDLLTEAGAEVIELPTNGEITLDSIYARDALLVSPDGLIVCTMGRASRNHEPALNAAALGAMGFPVAGVIEAPGTIEGGDLIWLDETALAVGLGPRTNADGIEQLKAILGGGVDVHVVPLPAPDHPEDVFHLMSMISPLDRDLALVYRPLMPDSFVAWLASKGVELVEVPEEEFIPMGCNVLAVGPRDVVMLDRLPETRARLESAGCRVQTYKGDEISRKGEGGPTCLTRPLRRDV
ncbi:dimethylarginine dimethylaminohydrolase family protein [Kordiimonas marina]|uniref:dimethylarginine dimethylaminohydrolase family protein n=1 Tax=Kordiimonas marina TaxID=2872312 RepID=UPI001FF44257|nr:arginine deiminase family protein [Kordiimonas marina]MCJ9429446.1 amidinotransferase [Kordiimonas marina]